MTEHPINLDALEVTARAAMELRPIDASRITAFDPLTVLALLERVRVAEAKVARVEALVQPFREDECYEGHSDRLRAALTPTDEKAACVSEAAQDAAGDAQPGSGVSEGHQQHAGPRECCASGRCEVCTPGYDWGRDG